MFMFAFKTTKQMLFNRKIKEKKDENDEYSDDIKKIKTQSETVCL